MAKHCAAKRSPNLYVQSFQTYVKKRVKEGRIDEPMCHEEEGFFDCELMCPINQLRCASNASQPCLDLSHRISVSMGIGILRNMARIVPKHQGTSRTLIIMGRPAADHEHRAGGNG
jgi:hypothetical protein